MRTFAGIAAGLALASGAAVAAAAMIPDPQSAGRSTDTRGKEVVKATEVAADDEQKGGDARRLAVLAGRGSQIGVTVSDLDPQTAAGKSGALVEDVREGSAAGKAGIQKGDVITEFDGERVRGVRHLTRLVTETPDGRAVKTVVEREGQRVDLTVTPDSGAMAFGGRDFEVVVPPMRFEHLPGIERKLRRELERVPREGTWSFRGRPGDLFSFSTGGRGRLGVSIQPVEGQLAEYFGTGRGVLVTSVEQDSPAAKAGLKAGDVVTAIDGKAVAEPSELIDAVRAAGDGATLTIDFLRDKQPQSVKAELDKREAPAEKPRRSARPI